MENKKNSMKMVLPSFSSVGGFSHDAMINAQNAIFGALLTTFMIKNLKSYLAKPKNTLSFSNCSNDDLLSKVDWYIDQISSGSNKSELFHLQIMRIFSLLEERGVNLD